MGHIRNNIKLWEELHNKQEFVMDFMIKERVINKSRCGMCKPLYKLKDNKIICANEELAKELFNYLKDMLENDKN